MDLKTNLIRTYYPSIPSRINTETDFRPFDQTTLEKAIDDYLTLPLPSKNATSYNSAWMQKDLEHLNRKLSAVRKTITAWDTYKITEVVIEKELLAGKIQGLPLNSSLVVNTSEPVYLNGKTYQLGDIVFKDINGNLHQIKSAPSGFFYPSNITMTGSDSNTIKIDYSFFAGSQPSLSEQTIDQDDNKALTEPSYDITTTLTLSEDTSFYNQSGYLQADTAPVKIPALKNDNNLVIPKVFAYLYNSDTETALEEVYVDSLFTIEEVADGITSETTVTNISIENPTTFTIKYIMR